MSWKRLMWANDFPHSDSTWPWSQELLGKHTADLTEEQTKAILCDNGFHRAIPPAALGENAG